MRAGTRSDSRRLCSGSTGTSGQTARGPPPAAALWHTASDTSLYGSEYSVVAAAITPPRPRAVGAAYARLARGRSNKIELDNIFFTALLNHLASRAFGWELILQHIADAEVRERSGRAVPAPCLRPLARSLALDWLHAPPRQLPFPSGSRRQKYTTSLRARLSLALQQS